MHRFWRMAKPEDLPARLAAHKPSVNNKRLLDKVSLAARQEVGVMWCGVVWTVGWEGQRS